MHLWDVQKTNLVDGSRLSTVYNPVAFWPTGGQRPPAGQVAHHYETARLWPDGDVEPLETYAMREDARHGHYRWLRRVQEA